MTLSAPSTAVVTPINVGSTYVMPPDAMGAEALAYNLDFSMADDDLAMPVTYVASVDANSGSILEWYELESSDATNLTRPRRLVSFFHRSKVANKIPLSLLAFHLSGKLAKLVHPPLLIEDRPFMCVDYLSYEASNARVLHRNGEIVLTGSSKRVVLDERKQTFLLDGVRHKTVCQPHSVDGYYYVPLDVVQAVLPGKWSYDAKARTVRFDPPRPRQARK